MNIVIIYKQDGTIQCDPNQKPRPLAEDEQRLTSAGVGKIYGSGNVPGPNVVIQLCGLPTSQVNAFAISAADWGKLQSGIVGTLGFRLWVGAQLPKFAAEKNVEVEPGPVTTPMTGNIQAYPVLIRELIGRPVRCYREGDAVTMDFRPERVNIVTDAASVIVDIYFG